MFDIVDHILAPVTLFCDAGLSTYSNTAPEPTRLRSRWAFRFRLSRRHIVPSCLQNEPVPWLRGLYSFTRLFFSTQLLVLSLKERGRTKFFVPPLRIAMIQTKNSTS